MKTNNLFTTASSYLIPSASLPVFSLSLKLRSRFFKRPTVCSNPFMQIKYELFTPNMCQFVISVLLFQNCFPHAMWRYCWQSWNEIVQNWKLLGSIGIKLYHSVRSFLFIVRSVIRNAGLFGFAALVPWTKFASARYRAESKGYRIVFDIEQHTRNTTASCHSWIFTFARCINNFTTGCMSRYCRMIYFFSVRRIHVSLNVIMIVSCTIL